MNEINQKCIYIICGREICPKTGRLHDQGFLYLKNPLNAVKNKEGIWFNKRLAKSLGGCFTSACNGTLDENCTYCSKDSNVKEFGTRPKQGFRTDLDEYASLILSGSQTVEDIVIENPMIYHQYGRTLNKLEDIAIRYKWRTWMTEGIWCWGPAGTGKSHDYLHNFHPDNIYNYPNDNGWWDDYRGQPIVVINEFRISDMTYSELLTLVDKWPKDVKRRNRPPRPFLAQKLIITSSMSPEDTFDDHVDKLEQFYRRFKIISYEEMEQKWSTGNIS